jgi:GST-like protein
MLDPTLDLFTWHTPDGRAPAILLAELAMPYNLHLVDASRGEHRRLGYLELVPTGNLPALVDRDPNLGRVVVFEPGAIFDYLGEKSRRFLPVMLGARRAEVLSWLFWQSAGVAPVFGQLEHFARLEPRDDVAYAIFFKEARRLVSALDQRLVDREFICEEYSVADMACYPWIEAMVAEHPEVLEGARQTGAWLRRVGARPAVKLGMKLEQGTRRAA